MTTVPSTGEALGAAALGMGRGMAMGSLMTSAEQPKPTQYPPPYYGYPPQSPCSYSPPPPAEGRTLYSLPPGAFVTEIDGVTHYLANGTYYKPFYSGSQVPYLPSAAIVATRKAPPLSIFEHRKIPKEERI